MMHKGRLQLRSSISASSSACLLRSSSVPDTSRCTPSRRATLALKCPTQAVTYCSHSGDCRGNSGGATPPGWEAQALKQSDSTLAKQRKALLHAANVRILDIQVPEVGGMRLRIAIPGGL